MLTPGRARWMMWSRMRPPTRTRNRRPPERNPEPPRRKPAPIPTPEGRRRPSGCRREKPARIPPTGRLRTKTVSPLPQQPQRQQHSREAGPKAIRARSRSPERLRRERKRARMGQPAFSSDAGIEAVAA
jgi:hypothetical protein